MSGLGNSQRRTPPSIPASFLFMLRGPHATTSSRLQLLHHQLEASGRRTPPEKGNKHGGSPIRAPCRGRGQADRLGRQGAPPAGQRPRPHLPQGRGKGTGSGVPTVPRAALRGRAGAGRGERSAERAACTASAAAASAATAAPRPPPAQLCARGLSPPTSARPCGRRVHLHIRVRAGAPDTPLVEIRRGARSLTNPARERRGRARGGQSERARAGPAGPGGVRDARCGRRRRPRGPPWCEAPPR